MIRVCFVCLGNICRSPTAEGIFRGLVDQSGLSAHCVIDSAGTSGWHIGDPPDARATAAAARRGYFLAGSSRQFKVRDFDLFDYVIAMDSENLADLRRLCRDDDDRAKLSLMREHEPGGSGDVPDPFYGGAYGFDDVFDICERACRGLIERICRDYDIPDPT